jgi:UDP-N-acetylglucosamine--N-acetylmuramyl-(pentapeptide) pyrophosphoryl-undecaprenol N-acetylglucosamine transferase
VDKVFVATEKASKYMAHPEKCIPCGNPVRQEIIDADTLRAKEELGVQGKLVVLSFGGSLGAAMVNKAMQHLVAHNKNREDIVHFHVVGRYDEGEFERYLKDNNLNDENKIKVYEYLYDIAKYMAAADVIICRCGALTIAELSCMGKASILIPSPNVTADHQRKNATLFCERGAAIMIEESELGDGKLDKTVKELILNKNLRDTLSQRISKLKTPTAAKNIVEILRTISKSTP